MISDKPEFEMNFYKRFEEDESQMEEIVVKVQGDLIIYYKQGSAEGHFNINRVKMEFFENLSDENEAVIGEDFCVLLSHDKMFDTFFCLSLNDF